VVEVVWAAEVVAMAGIKGVSQAGAAWETAQAGTRVRCKATVAMGDNRVMAATEGSKAMVSRDMTSHGTSKDTANNRMASSKLGVDNSRAGEVSKAKNTAMGSSRATVVLSNSQPLVVMVGSNSGGKMAQMVMAQLVVMEVTVVHRPRSKATAEAMGSRVANKEAPHLARQPQ